MARNLSVSQAGTFQTCTYKWYLEYQLGLKKASTEVSSMSLGSLVHEGLSAAMYAYYSDQTNDEPLNTSNALEAAYEYMLEWRKNQVGIAYGTVITQDGVEHPPLTEEAIAWDEMLQTARDLVTLTLADIDIPKNYTVVSVVNEEGEVIPLIEHWMTLPVEGTDFVFRGIVDVVLKDNSDDQLEVVDWKTRKSFTNDMAEQMNMQLGIYQYMLDKLYGVYAPIGTIYQIKSVLSKSPLKNRDGSLNKRRAAYKTHQITSVVRNRAIQMRIWFNLVQHAHRIAAFDPEQRVARAYGMACSWCSYRDICYAELHGYDAQDIMDTMYERKE